MRHEFPRRRTFDSLRQEAKRWLAALREHVGEARTRLAHALREVPARPTLRDVQRALAREHGFPGWTALKRALSPDAAVSARTLAQYEEMAAALLDAYRTGTPAAMERHYARTWHRRAWPAMRTYVQLDLGRRPAGPDDQVDITLDDARHLVAVEHGFGSWAALRAYVAAMPGRMPFMANPVLVASMRPDGGDRVVARTRDWDAALRLLEQTTSPGLGVPRQMTDAMLKDIGRLEHLEALHVAGARQATDEGLRHLAGLKGLRQLVISGTAITDRGLAALRGLSKLEMLSLAGTSVTDEGLRHLAGCHALRDVDLTATRTGDGAIRALAGKPGLHRFRSGALVTDAGLALFLEWPVFRTWQGGVETMDLLSYDAGPSYLQLRGRLTDAGFHRLQGLDGLFALNLADRALGITAACLRPLAALPNLGWLAAEATDDWMAGFAELPRLRFLGVQDTPAGDEGFVALSRSQSIERIWGRRCHNLRRRGFLALAEMPALRSLSVSCLNVDDEGIASMPRFPALRELMPMDVPDAGYRHIAKCERLESLILMYCRDTTDAATEHIVSLRRLSHYSNSYTTITDRTPELLSGMDSIERITFDACHGLTDAGIAKLARLPRLKELRASGRGITTAVGAPFPRSIAVNPEE